MLCPPLGVLVVVLDGSTVGTTREHISLLRDTRNQSGRSGVRGQSNGQRCKRSSLRVQNSTGFSLMRCPVVVQDDGWPVLCSLTNRTSRTKKLQELEYIYPFFQPAPAFAFPPVCYKPRGSSTLLPSCDLHKSSPLISKHTQKSNQL